MAMEVAQIRLLREFFGIHYNKARLAIGYSLGEICGWFAAEFSSSNTPCASRLQWRPIRRTRS